MSIKCQNAFVYLKSQWVAKMLGSDDYRKLTQKQKKLFCGGKAMVVHKFLGESMVTLMMRPAFTGSLMLLKCPLYLKTDRVM